MNIRKNSSPGHSSMKLPRVRVALALLAVPAALSAQKKVLTQADWDLWKSINAPALTNDGNWLVYTIVPQVGDGELVIRSTHGSTEYRVPRGFIGRPNNTPGALRNTGNGSPNGEPADVPVTPPQLSGDSKYVVVAVQPS